MLGKPGQTKAKIMYPLLSWFVAMVKSMTSMVKFRRIKFKA